MKDSAGNLQNQIDELSENFDAFKQVFDSFKQTSGVYCKIIKESCAYQFDNIVYSNTYTQQLGKLIEDGTPFLLMLPGSDQSVAPTFYGYDPEATYKIGSNVGTVSPDLGFAANTAYLYYKNGEVYVQAYYYSAGLTNPYSVSGSFTFSNGLVVFYTKN